MGVTIVRHERLRAYGIYIMHNASHHLDIISSPGIGFSCRNANYFLNILF